MQLGRKPTPLKEGIKLTIQHYKEFYTRTDMEKRSTISRQGVHRRFHSSQAWRKWGVVKIQSPAQGEYLAVPKENLWLWELDGLDRTEDQVLEGEMPTYKLNSELL